MESNASSAVVREVTKHFHRNVTKNFNISNTHHHQYGGEATAALVMSILAAIIVLLVVAWVYGPQIRARAAQAWANRPRQYVFGIL